MTQAAKVAKMLGGSPVLGRRIARDADLELVVGAGVPAQALRVLADRTSSTLADIQRIIAIDKSTFNRRIRARAKLKSDESDRVVRFARVAALAIDALGDEDGLVWLHEKNRALGDRTPIQMLGTDAGARQVEHILGRIEHGVFS